ncbi:MAG: GGDEF domain-containing protein, partial [Ruminococcus sp.]|nr:GGDEF domain-containing protein [Ruminococcus sp.]
FAAGILVFFVLISFGISFSCVHIIGSRYCERAASAALDFSALTINADKARTSFKTRIKSDDYESVQNKLSAYQRSNSDIISRISLVSFSNTSGIYIYDSGGEPLGSHLDYTSYTSSVKAELINGRNSMKHVSKGRLTVYRPLRTVDDNLCGIVIVQLQEPFEKQYFMFIAAVFGALLLLGALFVLILILHLKKKISSPLRQISSYISSIQKSEEKQEQADASVILDDTREDEIGQLTASLKELLCSLDTGEKDLLQAVYDANHDGMTQLFNKRYYHSMVDTFRKYDSLLFIYFDVNNLKLINDTLGHESGDFVIKRAAAYIRELLEDGDYGFRMGGDEFLIVMTKGPLRRLDRIMDKLNEDSPYILSRKSDPIKCSLSYGCSYANGVFSYDALLAKAEENMYIKKAEIKKLLQMPDR